VNVKEWLNFVSFHVPNAFIGILESPVKFFGSDVKCLYDFHQQDSVTLQMSSAALMSADLADLMLATTVLPKTMIANMKTKSFIRKKASWLG
jgi:hypothetical protein